MIATIRAALRSLTALGWAVVVACLAILLLLATCAHHSAKEARQSRDAAEERARALDAGLKASEAASGERMADVQIIYNHEKELTDAVASLPDAVPSPRRIALACQRLRQQGNRDADLPAQCRSGS